jgi:hypothetical protein
MQHQCWTSDAVGSTPTHLPTTVERTATDQRDHHYDQSMLRRQCATMMVELQLTVARQWPSDSASQQNCSDGEQSACHWNRCHSKSYRHQDHHSAIDQETMHQCSGLLEAERAKKKKKKKNGKVKATQKISEKLEISHQTTLVHMRHANCRRESR